MIYKARAVFIGNRRTTVRLAPVMWEALEDIARYQSIGLSDLLRKIEDGCEPDQGLADAIRIYIVRFYRGLVSGSMTKPHM
jgi:predicted DNA-binding ribbon-helix-helix protein